MQTIFVSSTFEDMHEERDLLRDRVAPLINDEAGRYAQTVDFCDLRWGINTEDMTEEASSRKVLDVCLGEIRRSSPPFVILLGARYGWIPGEKLIRQAAAAQSFPLEDCEKSVTALEIEYGAFFLKYPTFVYVKNAEKMENPRIQTLVERLGRLPNVTLRQYTMDPVEENPVSALYEEMFDVDDYDDPETDRIWQAKKETPEVRRMQQEYDRKIAGWQAQRQRFCDRVREDLLAYFRSQWKQPESALQKELMVHWSLLEEKNRQFRVREAEAQALIEALEGGRNPVTVRGGEGMGKTTLLAHIACTMRERGWEVLPIVAGLTAATRDVRGILQLTLAYLQEKLGMEQTGGERLGMRSRILELSREYEKTGGRLLVLVDGVERLRSSESPMKLVCCGGGVSYFLTGGASVRFPDPQCHDLEPLGWMELQQVALGILASRGRELPGEILNKISYYGNSPREISRIIQRMCQMEGLELQKKSHEDFTDHLKESMRVILKLSSVRLRKAYLISYRVLDALALSQTGLRMEDMAAIGGTEWRRTDFLQMVDEDSEEYIRTADGFFRFAHQPWEAEDTGVLLAHLRTLPKGDPVKEGDYVYQLARYAEEKEAAEVLCEIAASDGPVRQDSAVICLADLVLEGREDRLCRILSASGDSRLGRFVMENLIPQLEEAGSRAIVSILRTLRRLPVEGEQDRYLLRMLPAVGILDREESDDWQLLVQEILDWAEAVLALDPDMETRNTLVPPLSAAAGKRDGGEALLRRIREALEDLSTEEFVADRLRYYDPELARAWIPASPERAGAMLLELSRKEPDVLGKLPGYIRGCVCLLQLADLHQDPRQLLRSVELGRDALEKLNLLRLRLGEPTLFSEERAVLCESTGILLYAVSYLTGEDYGEEILRNLADAVEEYSLRLQESDELGNLIILSVAASVLEDLQDVPRQELLHLEQSLTLLRRELENRKAPELKEAYHNLRISFVHVLERVPQCAQLAAAYREDPRYTLVGQRGQPSIQEVPVQKILKAHPGVKKLTIVGQNEGKRVENARKAYADPEIIGEIKALYDTGFLKNGKKGAAFGTLGMAISGTGAFRYDAVTRASLRAETLVLTLAEEDPREVDFGSDGAILCELLNDIQNHLF